MRLGYEQSSWTSNVDGHGSIVVRFERGDLKCVKVNYRASHPIALACGGFAVITGESGSSATGLRNEFGWNDQIDGHGDVAVEPGTLESLLPDAWFACAFETGVEHGVAEERDSGELRWVDSEVSVGSERLIGGESPGCAEIDRLSTNQDDRSDMWLKSSERIEQDPSSLHILDAGLVGHRSATFLVSDGACQRLVLMLIHSMSASPSAGMRLGPVRQSIAVCAAET